MNALAPAAPLVLTRKRLWTGRILSGLTILFLLWDGVIKLLNITPVVESFARLGYREDLGVAIGTLELACLVLHVAPRTAALGAILLTAFLGGATATHVRVGDPFWFPILVGVLLWAGLLLREERLRALIPSRA